MGSPILRVCCVLIDYVASLMCLPPLSLHLVVDVVFVVVAAASLAAPLHLLFLHYPFHCLSPFDGMSLPLRYTGMLPLTPFRV